MYWQEYLDIGSPKVDADVSSQCAICCTTVPSGEMWGLQDEEHEKHGWVVCGHCYSRYQDAPLTAWQKAEDRWNTDGPCVKLKEAVLSGR